MADSAKIKSSIGIVGKLVKTVIANLQARPDYSASSQLKAMASQLRTFSQHLLNNEISGTVQTYQELRTEASHRIVPAVHQLIDANIDMAGLGQLNTKRKVQPAVLQSHNKTLQSLLEALENMVAQIGAPGTTQTSSTQTGNQTSSNQTGNKPASEGANQTPVQQNTKPDTSPSGQTPPMTGVMAPPPKDQVFKGKPNFKNIPTYQQLLNAPASSLSDDL